MFKKEGSILWVISEKRGSIFLSHIRKKIQFLESHSKKKGSWGHIQKKVQFFESHSKRRFNSLSHIQKKGSILWVIFKKKFNSLSQTKKNSFLRVIFYKKKTIFWNILLLKVTIFFESYWKKKFNSLSLKKGVQIHWDMFKIGFNSLSHILKRVQLLASYS